MRIILKTGKRWKDNEEELVRRIARIVCYDDTGVELKSGGYKWAINYRSNDWWASGIQDGEMELAYRYGTQENMEALHKVLNWLLGLED